MHHDPINAALWALSGFDTTCGKLADLREDIAARHPDGRDEVRTVIDNAIHIYVREQAAQLRDAGAYSDKQVDDIANAKLGVERISKATMQALACATRTDNYHLMVHIAIYAITLGALSNFGPPPFNRFADMMQECYAQLYPKPYKTQPLEVKK